MWHLYNYVGIENSLLTASELQIRKNGRTGDWVISFIVLFQVELNLTNITNRNRTRTRIIS